MRLIEPLAFTSMLKPAELSRRKGKFADDAFRGVIGSFLESFL
jgi:hypothetical protein